MENKNSTKILDLQEELSKQFPEEYNKFWAGMDRVIRDIAGTVNDSVYREKFAGKWLELAQKEK